VNYHIEHHLYASVPHYHLPELHREMASRGVLEGAEVVMFSATLRKIFSEKRTAISA
jgi:fatty acid desaturase